MSPLEGLARETTPQRQGMARTIPIHTITDAESEVARVLQICNACRYCEGYCAVFPAMTRRLSFGGADIHYLANLCHNCGACLHACQYASPHEFSVNVPQAMAKVRVQTYADYAWPSSLGVLYKRNGLTLSLAVAAGLALFLILAMALNGTMWSAPNGDSFYSVFPHNLLLILFAPVFLFAVVALGCGVWRFSKEITVGTTTSVAVGEASRDVLSLKYLGGGHGMGCNNDDERFTLSRKRYHHFTFYGFILCFAATGAATIYHYFLGIIAPYDFLTLPKLLGVAGGISLLVGTAGLLSLNLRRAQEHGDAAQRSMDRGFTVLLFLASLTGLVLWIGRGTAALPFLLAVHLGIVMSLFVTLPYGKFAHGVFRAAALLKWRIEKRQVNGLSFKSD